MRNLILFILSTLAFLMHPLSLSAQNSFSLSLDVNSATGDQAVTSLNTSPDQVIAIQIFGKDIQNATGVSVRFEYDAGQVTYEGFDTGTVLPNANALTEQGTNPTFVKIGVVSFGGQATVNEGLIGTIRFRTLAAFSGSAIRLVRGELARGGQIQSRTLDLRVALQKLPTSFSLSLDVNSSAGDQAATSVAVPADESVAVQVFGDDLEGAEGVSLRFEYDANQVSYERFDAGSVLPNAQVGRREGSSYVEISLTSSGQATSNSGLIGTIRFRTLTAFSGSAIRLVRGDLTRGGQTQSKILNLRVALVKKLPTSFSLSLDVNRASGDQGATSAIVSAGKDVAIQVFGEDLIGASGVSLRFEYDAGQVVYEGFDAGAVLPNAQATRQQGSNFVEITLTSSGQATSNSGLVGTMRFRTLTAFSGSAIRLVRGDLTRGGQTQSRTLNLRVALVKKLPTSFSLSLDVNSSSGDQAATSAVVSAGDGVAIQVFGEDFLGASGVSLRFEYDAAQVSYERFDEGAVLPNAQVGRQQGSGYVEISLTSSGQAKVNSGLVGTIRFRTLTAFSGSAIRLVRADLVRGGQTQRRTLNLRVALQRSLPTSFSLSLDVNSAGGDQSVTSAVVSAGDGVAIQVFGENLLGATNISLRFKYDAALVAYERFDAGSVLPNARVGRQRGLNFVEVSLTSSGQATANSGLIGTIRFRTLAASNSAIQLVRADLTRGGQTQSKTLNLRVALQRSLPTSFSLSLDANSSSGNQGVTSAVVSVGEGVAIQVFGEDLLGATDISLRFEYDAAQVAYERFDVGSVLPNARATRQQGSSYVELSLTSSGQATSNSGLVGTIRFRTLGAFSGSAVRLVRADLVRGGQTQRRTLNLRVALQKSLPTSFSLSLDVNSASGDQSVTSTTVSAGEDVAIQVFGEDLLGATDISLRFEYDAAQVAYERFDAGSVLPNAQATRQQGSSYVEISLTSSGQATFNSGLIGTIRFRTLVAFSGSAIRLVRADLTRGSQTQRRTLNLRVALQRALPTSFSLSLDVNGSAGDQSVTSVTVSAGEGVAVQVFGTDIQNATGVSIRFEYDGGQVVHEGFDAGSVLPNVQVLTEQGTSPTFVEIGLVSLGGQATVNSGLVGTIRFRTLAAFSGSAIRLVRGELARGGQIQSVPLNLRVELQLSVSTAPSPDFNGNGRVDIPDFLLFVDALGTQAGQAGYESKYDLDGNGVIGVPDFLIFIDNFSKEVSTPSGSGGGGGGSGSSGGSGGDSGGGGGSGGSGGDSGSGGGTMQVAIPDANLRAAIAAELGKARGAPITRDEMATLTRLRVSNANIRNLTGLEFATSMRELNLHSNSISDVSALSALTSLTWLYLHGNSISDVSGLSGLTNLVILDLGENRISDVSDLSGLTSLTALGLSGNSISDVSALSGLTRLRSLLLNENNITDMSVLSGLTNLEKLRLYNNNISDWSTLSGLTNLESLDLGSNNITDVSMLSGLTNLESLWLSGNNITDVSMLSGLTRLTWLDLGSNNITDVSMLSGLTNLESLYLDSNNISDVSALSVLTSLTWLNLYNNGITDVSALSGLTNLNTLFLSHNAITDASHLSGLTNLERLYLHANRITDVSALSGLTRLRVLTLGANRITDVSALSGLTNLTRLNLYNNSISDLAPLVANTGLDNGDEVDVQNNPLSAISINTHIPALQSRGVDVRFGASKPAVEQE